MDFGDLRKNTVLQTALAFWQPQAANAGQMLDILLEPLSGGDCSEVYLLQSKTGAFPPVCLKVARDSGRVPLPESPCLGQLRTEALSLRAMASVPVPDGHFVPEPLCWRQDKDVQVLLLEYMALCGPRPHSYVDSRGLAQLLHRLHFAPPSLRTGGLWNETSNRIFDLTEEQSAKLRAGQEKLLTGQWLGFFCNNFIGMTGQQNLPKTGFFRASEWPDFFDQFRLRPLLEACARKGLLGKREQGAGENLCRHLGELLPRLERASLLHGDLWSGNVLWWGERGDRKPKACPILIDPACYYGHHEVDLAMTKMFGGFSIDFYREYYSLQAADPGWEQRFEIYNLYHWLNHLLMFGHSYLGAVRRVLSPFSL
ncbi:fructosamine kinase family protein [Candidatus Haliotispira prima]|uniref:Fructosamine kinase family protein n=1 Tax=Candidatus Haliotispira prima TaxID=3034016 RepID=A0ABY8MDY7_9SPIO|nr:fructosamine kinase family protein [Candidatus Haliotispira prima]